MLIEPSAKVILDSLHADGVSRLTTMEVVLHRFTLSEFNTHRAFCFAGDAKLEFDLPAGTTRNRKHRRVFRMTAARFVEKWENGAYPRPNNPKRTLDCSQIADNLRYSVHELVALSGLETPGNLNTLCRTGVLPGIKRDDKAWSLLGSEFKAWRQSGATVNRQGMRAKLKEMRIRQFDENTGMIVTSHVKDCTQSGMKEVFEIRAGKRKIAGSADHLILSEEGWIRIGDIIPGVTKIMIQKTGKMLKGGIYLYGALQLVDSVTLRGMEPTYDLEIEGEFANFIANGVVVHNSRSSASSRAIPLKKQLERVTVNPAIPVSWPAEQKGMQGGDELPAETQIKSRQIWLNARIEAMAAAKRLGELGVHKSIANRLLEPFMWHTVIVTSTEWENFWELRCNALAQPEIRIVAEKMRDAYNASSPNRLFYGGWHLPYVTGYDWDEMVKEYGEADALVLARRCSVARCARVSYLTHDTGQRDWEKDAQLYERLINPGEGPAHASPLEHVATPSTPFYGTLGNFKYWTQLRHVYKNIP